MSEGQSLEAQGPPPAIEDASEGQSLEAAGTVSGARIARFELAPSAVMVTSRGLSLGQVHVRQGWCVRRTFDLTAPGNPVVWVVFFVSVALAVNVSFAVHFLYNLSAF